MTAPFRYDTAGNPVDWQGYRMDVPREEQCHKRDGNLRRYCEREKGHTGNHKAGATQWGAA